MYDVSGSSSIRAWTSDTDIPDAIQKNRALSKPIYIRDEIIIIIFAFS